MEKILSYICFENAKAFEKWQKDNQTNKVLNIQPILTRINFDIQGSDKGCKADATTSIRTFVTYWKDI